MGSAKNSDHSSEEKQDILRKAKKLEPSLDKPIDGFSGVDHNALDLAFDKHLFDSQSGEAQLSGSPNDPEEVPKKASLFGGSKKQKHR